MEDEVNKKNKNVLWASIAVVALIVLIYMVIGTSKGDRIVVKVNGESILQSELDQRFDQETKRAVLQGFNTSDEEIVTQVKDQILEELINRELLIQAATESGIEIASGDVESELALIKEQFGGEEEFLAQLSEFGIKEDKFREEVANQIMVQQYISENIDLDSVVVTDEEIESAYKDASAEIEDIPPLAEVKQQISIQITQEKQQELLNILIESLRTKAEIVIL